MAFVVSSLTNYVDEQSKDLLTAAIFGNETAAYANVQTGIKSAEQLQLMDNSVTFQDGTSCTFNALGDTTFTQRKLTVGAIRVDREWCLNDLEPKWTQLLLKKGSNYTEADIPKMIVDDIIKQINKKLEVADWQSNLLNGDANLNKYDGILAILSGATGVVNVSTGVNIVNTANIRTVLRNAIAAVPAALKHDPDFMFFTGYDILDIYQNALSTDNAFNIWGTDANTGEIKIENTVYKLKATHGLDGLNTSGHTIMVGMKPSTNLFMGTDLETDFEQMRLWQSLDNGGKIRLTTRWRRGWQVAFPSETVLVANV